MKVTPGSEVKFITLRPSTIKPGTVFCICDWQNQLDQMLKLPGKKQIRGIITRMKIFDEEKKKVYFKLCISTFVLL